MNIGQLIVTLGVDTSGLNTATAALQNFQRTATTNMNNVSAVLERTSNQFQRFGSAANRYLTLPLLAAGGAAIKMAADLEYSTQKIVALAGVGQSQVDAWKGKMIALSNETGVSQKSIADTLYYVASAGIKAKEALEITEIAAKASAAGLGEMSDMGRLLTYAINAYGKENITAARAADAITIAVREGTAEASTMVSVIGDLIPVAAAMGVSFDQVTGSVAAMTRTGFNAHKSATALRQIMVSLLHPTVESKRALDTWSKALNDSSYTAEGLRKTIREKGLIEALIKIDNLTKQFGESAAGIVFGNVRALTGDLSLVGKNMEAVYEIIQKSKNETGAFATAFSIMTGTSTFKLTQLRSALQNTFIGLGQSMLTPLNSVLEDLIDILKNLTTWWKNLNTTTQEWIIKSAVLLAAVGPIAMAFAGLIKIYSGMRIVLLLTVDAFILLKTVSAVAFQAIIVGAKAAFAALVMNPELLVLVTGLGIAFGGLAIAMSRAKEKATELTATQKMLLDIDSQALQSTVNERIEIEKLLSIVKSEYSTKQDKAAAIKQLNAMSPTYLGAITEEQVLTGKATSAIDTYIESLRKKATAQASQEMWVEEEKRRIANLSAAQKGDFRYQDVKKVAGTFPAMMVTIGAFKVNESGKKAISDLINREATDNIMALQGNVFAAFTSNENLVDSMKTLKSTLDAISTIKPKDLDAAEIDDLRKRIDTQIGQEIAYTGTIKEELDKRLSYDSKLQELKKSLVNAEVATTTAAYKAGIAKQIQDRKDAITQEYQLKYNANQQDLKLLSGWSVSVDNMIKSMPEKSLGLGDPGKSKDRLTELQELMKTASGERLNQLANEWLGLESVRLKQEELIDQAIYLAKINAEGDNYSSYKLADSFDWKGSGMSNNIDLTGHGVLGTQAGLKTPTNEPSFSGMFGPAVDSTPIDTKKLVIMKMLTAEQIKQLALAGVAADKEQKLTAWWDKQRELKKGSYAQIAREVQRYSQGINDLLSAYSSLMDAKKNKAFAAIDAIAKADHKSAKWVAREKERIEHEYAKKSKAVAVAQALINTAVAVTMALSSAPPPFNLILAAMSAAAGAMQVAAIKATPMANGGTIPAGYPNDSYPAMLTSGETVVPPGKLPNFQNAQRELKFKPLVFELDGRVIRAALELENEFVKSF